MTHPIVPPVTAPMIAEAFRSSHRNARSRQDRCTRTGAPPSARMTSTEMDSHRFHERKSFPGTASFSRKPSKAEDHPAAGEGAPAMDSRPRFRWGQALRGNDESAGLGGGVDEEWRPVHFPSFPRKRESMKNNRLQGASCRRESIGRFPGVMRSDTRSEA